MANIQSYLDQIEKARYGKDVRSSIVGAIDAVNQESNESVKKVNTAEENINKLVNDSITATANATKATQEANTAAANANEASQAIFDEKYILTSRTEFANQATVAPTSKGNAIVESIKGDSYQKHLSGKNLYNYRDTSSVTNCTVDEDGWVTVSYDNSSGESIGFSNYFTNINNLLKTNTQYALVAEIAQLSNGCTLRINSTAPNGDTDQFANVNIGILRTSGTHIVLDTTKDNFTDSKIIACLRTYVDISAGSNATVKYRISILEDTTVTADTFVYEPYCGGIPSPNPYYMQEIESVGDSGSVKVKCVNETSSEESTIIIPLTEPLRAIGDVKDEIMCIDGVYGIMRRICKKIFNGSEDFGFIKNNNLQYCRITIEDYKYVNDYIINYACSHYIPISVSGRYIDKTVFINNQKMVFFTNIDFSSADDFKTWLFSNNITLHYELATPIFEPFEDQTPFYNLMAIDEVTNISFVGESENVNPSAQIRFPRHEDGALAMTAFCDGKKNEIKLNELTNAVLLLGQA